MQTKSVTDITIIIPSLNPDEKFIKTLDGILSKGFHKIVVVDDGSDANHKIPFHYALEKSCQVLVHKKNQGKGRALKTAFDYCFQQADCIGVITVDGDGQHSPDDIYACGEVLLRTGKVVLGCRDFSEPQVPFKSKYGNTITKFIFKSLCGIHLSDTQTGLRAIPAKYLPAMINFKGERFEYETNMLLEMKSCNIPWEEVKIETIYLNENESSHFRPFRDGWRIYKIILRYSLFDSTLLKYVLSSGLCALVDLLAFCGILYFLGSYTLPTQSHRILVATIIARALSSLTNYTTNRKIVFQSDNKGSFFKYYALCLVQMLASAGLVSALSQVFYTGPIGKTFIKLFVDVVLFFISFSFQKKWVFAKKEVADELGI